MHSNDVHVCHWHETDSKNKNKTPYSKNTSFRLKPLYITFCSFIHLLLFCFVCLQDRGSSTTSHLPAIIGRADFDSVCERFRRRYRVWLRSAPLQHDPDPYEQYKVQPLVSSGDENSQ